MLGKISPQKRLSSTATGFPGKLLSPSSWRFLQDVQTWHLGTWSGGGLVSTLLMIALYNLQGLFQPK